MAGGVLSGNSGIIVQCQTRRFLLKYYDKIFGNDRILKPEDIVLANSKDSDFVGPFGAAMVSNRNHKLSAITFMKKRIDSIVQGCRSGEVIPLKTILSVQKDLRVEKKEIVDYLNLLISSGVINLDSKGNYLKPIEYDRPK